MVFETFKRIHGKLFLCTKTFVGVQCLIIIVVKKSL